MRSSEWLRPHRRLRSRVLLTQSQSHRDRYCNRPRTERRVAEPIHARRLTLPPPVSSGPTSGLARTRPVRRAATYGVPSGNHSSIPAASALRLLESLVCESSGMFLLRHAIGLSHVRYRGSPTRDEGARLRSDFPHIGWTSVLS